MIQAFRRFFRIDQYSTNEKLTASFLKRAGKLAKTGKAQVYFGGYKVLELMLTEADDDVFILVLKGSKIQKPKELKQWFSDYK